jgi:hypothetical protein
MDWKRFGAPLTVLMALTIGLVLAIQFMPRPKPMQAGKTLDRIPATIGEWSLLEKYPMSDAALNELKPDEYVARIYVNAAGEQADLSIIAGSHTGAFHNPQVCFRVQNWEFAENESITLNVPEREPIQARFVRLISLDGHAARGRGHLLLLDADGLPRRHLHRAHLSAAGAANGHGSATRLLRALLEDRVRATQQRDRESVKRFAEQVLAAMRDTNPEVVR